MQWKTLIPFPQMSNPRVKKLYCMCLRTMRQWSRWSLKEGVPTMRHVSRTHKVALDWLFDRINLGNFTRDEWNHLLCLFNISHFSSTVCSETMAKRLQQDSGEERVTAKSRQMMSLIAKVPSNVSSSTSVSPGKKSYGNHNPWSTIAGKEEGSGRPDIGIDRKTAFDHYYHEQFMEKFLFSKLLKVGWWPWLVFSRVENWYWDVRATGETQCNFLGSDTRIPTWFLSRGNSSWWNRAIRCEWGNTSWRIGETRCRFSKRSMASTIRHWKRWSRIRIVSRIKIIREPGEWSSAKKTETNFKCYRRWRKTFYDLRECSWL